MNKEIISFLKSNSIDKYDTEGFKNYLNDKKNDKDFLFQFIDSLFYFYNYKEDNQISKIIEIIF